MVDCHSFASTLLPYEPGQARDRADICMGTDRFHTPPELLANVVDVVRHS